MKLQEQLKSIAEEYPGTKLLTSRRRYLYFLPEMEREQKHAGFPFSSELNMELALIQSFSCCWQLLGSFSCSAIDWPFGFFFRV